MSSEDQGNKCGFYGADELNKAKFATKMPFFQEKEFSCVKICFQII